MLYNIIRAVVVLAAVIIYPVSFTLPAQAMEEAGTKLKIKKGTVTSITDMSELIAELRKNYKADEILIVSDLDGTLTTNQIPHDNLQAEAQPKGDDPKWIKRLIQEGYKVVISSANNDFDRTLKSLEDLGLTQVLNVGERSGVSYKKGTSAAGREVVGYVNGNVASYRLIDPKAAVPQYFRDKGIAPTLVYKSEDLKGVKAIVFFDDSADNIQFFKNNVTDYHSMVYPNVASLYLIQIDNTPPPHVIRVSAVFNKFPESFENKVHIKVPNDAIKSVTAKKIIGGQRVSLNENYNISNLNIINKIRFRQVINGKKMPSMKCVPNAATIENIRSNPQTLDAIKLDFTIKDEVLDCQILGAFKQGSPASTKPKERTKQNANMPIAFMQDKTTDPAVVDQAYKVFLTDLIKNFVPEEYQQRLTENVMRPTVCFKGDEINSYIVKQRVDVASLEKYKRQGGYYPSSSSCFANTASSKYWLDEFADETAIFKANDKAFGWKFHISALPHSATRIGKLVLDNINDLDGQVSRTVNFKLARSIPHIRTAWYIDGFSANNATQTGKFITIYPDNQQHAVALARKIDAVLNQALKDGVLTQEDFYPQSGDAQLGTSGALFARYGMYLSTDPTTQGRARLYEIEPSGKPVTRTDGAYQGRFIEVADDRFVPWPDFMNREMWRGVENPFAGLPLTWVSPTGKKVTWENRPEKWSDLIRNKRNAN